MAKKGKAGSEQAAKKRGPKPERLVLSGNWKDAVGYALTRGKPPASKQKKKRRSK